MKINKQQVSDRITKYIVEKLIPTTKNQGNTFKLAFVLPIVPSMVERFWPAGAELGIIDEAGLDTERLGVCLESGFKHAENLTIQGFKFGAEDAKKLISILNSPEYPV